MIEKVLSIIPDFAIDALKDSLNLVPFLFIIFVFIEIFENHYAKKITTFLKFSEKIGPILGAAFAIIPQCGFSIVATLLYVRKFISTGTLIAVYIATSDEAIPILIVKPEEIKTVGFLILIKLILAIVSGYVIDMLIKTHVKTFENKDEASAEEKEVETETGCCNHHFSEQNWKAVLLHPIKHTFLIFFFILAVCLGLNYMFEIFTQEKIEAVMLHHSLLQPVFAAVFGLIPNCAVSVLITMMYLKGVLSFGSVVAGLSSGAGLGLLVLIKRNSDIKNTVLIISLLLLISISAGLLLELYHF
ncbi:MAG: arsenic efflux protein [Candidatus Gastranaerophilales bacterium]|nr:arsenic efflux protein [Candidatus Gastranaerophilales bacterium]